MFKESLIQILVFIVLEIAKTQDLGHGMGTHGGGNPWIQMHNSDCCLQTLFTIHTALDVAPPKLLVPRPEIVSASSSIPVLAKPLAINGVQCSHGLRIVKVVPIVRGVVSEAVFN